MTNRSALLPTVLTRVAVLGAALLLPATGAFAATHDYLGAVPPKVTTVPSVVRTTCAACHGVTGNSPIPVYPNLAGQKYGYLLKQLEDFRSGARKSAIMQAMVKTIPAAPHAENLKAVAAWFSEQKLERHPPAAPPSADALKNGYQIYAFGQRKAGIPACAACHLDNGTGNGPMAIPALAGQHTEYVVTQLQQFASGKRANAPHHIMHLIAGRLDMQQIGALAGYIRLMRPSLLPGKELSSYARYEQALKDEVVPGVAKAALHAAPTATPATAASAASASATPAAAASAKPAGSGGADR